MDPFTHALCGKSTLGKLGPLLAQIQKPGQPNAAAGAILRAVHHSVDVNTNHTMPLELSHFLAAKSFSHDQQRDFIHRYGSTVSLSHSIDSMKLADAFKKKYLNSYTKRLSLMEPTEEIERLEKFIRRHYKQTSVILDPNRYGEPPQALKVKNLILKSLKQTQKDIKSSTIIPLDHLKRLDDELLSNGISDKFKEAYIQFLSQAISLDKQWNIHKSKWLEINYLASNQLSLLYK